MFWLLLLLSTLLSSAVGLYVVGSLVKRNAGSDLWNASFVAGLTSLSLCQILLYLQQFFDGLHNCGWFNGALTSLAVPLLLTWLMFNSAYTAKRHCRWLHYLLVGAVSYYAFQHFGTSGCSTCATTEGEFGPLMLGASSVPAMLLLSVYALIVRARQSTMHLKDWLKSHMFAMSAIFCASLVFSSTADVLLSGSLFLSVDYVRRNKVVEEVVVAEPVLANEEVVDEYVETSDLPVAVEYIYEEPDYPAVASSVNTQAEAVYNSEGNVALSYGNGTGNFAYSGAYNGKYNGPLPTLSQFSAGLASLKGTRGARKVRPTRSLKRGVYGKKKRVFRRKRQVDGTERLEEVIVNKDGVLQDLVFKNDKNEEFIEAVGQNDLTEIATTDDGKIIGLDIEPAAAGPFISTCPPCVQNGEQGHIVHEEVKNGINILQVEVPEAPLVEPAILPEPSLNTFGANLREQLCIPASEYNSRQLRKRHNLRRHIRSGRGNRAPVEFKRFYCYPPEVEISQNVVGVNEPVTTYVEEPYVAPIAEVEPEPYVEQPYVVADSGEKLADEIQVIDSGVIGEETVLIPGAEPISVPIGSTVEVVETVGEPTDTIIITEPDGVTERLEVAKPESEVASEQTLGEKLLGAVNSGFGLFQTAPTVAPVTLHQPGYSVLVNGVPCPEPCALSYVPNQTVVTERGRKNSLKRHIRRPTRVIRRK